MYPDVPGYAQQHQQRQVSRNPTCVLQPFTNIQPNKVQNDSYRKQA